MHDVVEMLLTRIKDYPEDFVIDPEGYRLGKYVEPTKWSQALQTAKEVMTEEERVVIDDAMEMAKRAIYMGAALKTIMSEEVAKPEPDPNTLTYKTAGRYAVQGLLGRTGMVNTASNYITEIERRQNEARLAQERAINQQYRTTSFLGQS